MALRIPIPKLGPTRPIAHKYMTNYKLAKLFEEPENPLELIRVLPDGKPILDPLK
jgi:hypothetical protein